MMPPRCGMHRGTGTGPSSMMAAAVVTAATCAQEENIQKHITPTITDDRKPASRKLCEMATQTIAISNIFVNAALTSTYQNIPFVDQIVPNLKEVMLSQNNSIEHEVINSNKINSNRNCSQKQPLMLRSTLPIQCIDSKIKEHQLTEHLLQKHTNAIQSISATTIISENNVIDTSL